MWHRTFAQCGKNSGGDVMLQMPNFYETKFPFQLYLNLIWTNCCKVNLLSLIFACLLVHNPSKCVSWAFKASLNCSFLSELLVTVFAFLKNRWSGEKQIDLWSRLRVKKVHDFCLHASECYLKNRVIKCFEKFDILW